MPLLWPFCPTPEFTETLEWTSDVIPTFNVEQRIRCTSAPRQTMSYAHSLSFRAYERAKLMMEDVGGGQWYIPLWHERQRVSVSSGSGSVSVLTSFSDYRADGYAMLWASEEINEVVPIAAVLPNSLTLSGVTAHSYSDGFITPVRVGYCPDGFSVDRSVQPIIPLSAEWRIWDNVDLAADGLYSTYRGYPAMHDAPRIGGGSIGEKLFRQVGSVDNGIAAPFFDTQSNRMTRALGMGWMVSTAEELWQLRTFLYSLYGRQKAFWLPDWTRGMQLTRDISSGDTSIKIRAIGLDNVAESGDIFIKTSGGSISRHQYTSVSYAAGEETLALSEAAGVNVSIGNARTVCPMRLCRLDQDRIELAHRHRGARRQQLTSVQVVANEVPFS